MRFTKMHGLGNDFLVVDDRTPAPVDWAALARRVCVPHVGVGADGILLIGRSQSADLRMRLFNADGGEAEMCGNGIRCTALLAASEGWASARASWETGAGTVVTVLGDDGEVTVDLGIPRLRAAEIPVLAASDQVLDEPIEVAGRELHITAIGMGNPHCVVVVDDVDTAPVTEIGPLLEHHPRFPARTNVEFVQILSSTAARQRTWERGVGETSACGTGAAAVGVATRLLGLTDAVLVVELRGGQLRIAWEPGGPVEMTGPAVLVYRGELELIPSELRGTAAVS